MAHTMVTFFNINLAFVRDGVVRFSHKDKIVDLQSDDYLEDSYYDSEREECAEDESDCSEVIIFYYEACLTIVEA